MGLLSDQILTSCDELGMEAQLQIEDLDQRERAKKEREEAEKRKQEGRQKSLNNVLGAACKMRSGR